MTLTFATGYTDALRDSLPREHRAAPLAPETVQRIFADCEAYEAWVGLALGVEDGLVFWREAGQ